mgnify:FL=1
MNNFVEREIRIYEQAPGEPCGSTGLREYAKRSVGWERVSGMRLPAFYTDAVPCVLMRENSVHGAQLCYGAWDTRVQIDVFFRLAFLT